MKKSLGGKIFITVHGFKILSKLNIGGKSGSIDNKAHDARYDWFVGFAEEKDGHERASHYARMAMKQYFRNYFAKKGSNRVYAGRQRGS
jgi:beta-lactamase class D